MRSTSATEGTVRLAGVSMGPPQGWRDGAPKWVLTSKRTPLWPIVKGTHDVLQFNSGNSNKKMPWLGTRAINKCQKCTELPLEIDPQANVIL